MRGHPFQNKTEKAHDLKIDHTIQSNLLFKATIGPNSYCIINNKLAQFPPLRNPKLAGNS